MPLLEPQVNFHFVWENINFMRMGKWQSMIPTVWSYPGTYKVKIVGFLLTHI